MNKAAVVITPEGGENIGAFGSDIQFKLEGTSTSGRLCLGLATTPPGGGPPLHVHHTDDELFIVVEGTLEVSTGSEWIPATAGSVVYLPRGVPHTFRNSGNTHSRHWVLTAPSGFEEFYRGASKILAAGTPPNYAALQALAAQHGYEFLTR